MTHTFWQGLGAGARAGLVAGAAAIVLLAGWGAWWILRTDFQVLFTDLKPQDAAVMTAELDRLKVPYRVGEDGASIWVDKAQVHTTRIKLMGKELPLHGAVGFELFNTTDFGMTEFAQKVNYQRALQGELTRTILALSEIRDVRVHLALPEQGLFRQAAARPKAAITVTLREGRALRPDQVQGIQRLVAAATPGMTPADVTVVDRQGVALSRLADEATPGVNPGGAAAGTRLEAKAATEAQLAAKAGAVLDRMFGAGQALASVDVTLNMDQVRTTTEDVLPGSSRAGDARGVIVKERESSRDPTAGVPPLDAVRAASAGGNSQREVDYQVGRRVEQVVSATGTVRRIHVAAVVRPALDANQEEKLRRLLAAAVGAAPERGDTIVVQSLAAVSRPETDAAAAPGAAASAGSAASTGATAATAANPVDRSAAGHAVWATYGWLLCGVLVLLLAASAVLWRRRATRPAASAAPMSETEREALLRQVQGWLAHGAVVPAEAEARP